VSRRRGVPSEGQPDLFSLDLARENLDRLGTFAWPDPGRFPVNLRGRTVRQVVWADLVDSEHPIVAAGYASIAQLIDLIAAWDGASHRRGAQVRVVLGSEPFDTDRTSFADPTRAFTREVHDHWFGRGYSLERSAKLVAAREAVRAGRVEVRAVVTAPSLHAKVYVGDEAATVGSSNLTAAGFSRQVEANARFTRGGDPDRYDELRRIAQNLLELGVDWTEPFLDLLDGLLQVVSWQEALGRACGELLDGDWFTSDAGAATGAGLWPSQVVGIAQAMWIVERVGSVLVADATGSGKTRMGAHLVKAVRGRLLSTGRTRNELTVLVCPPAVQDTWTREATATGVAITTISHGVLSRTSADDDRVEGVQVRQAQLLAVDEAHNFLNAGSQRTRMLRDNAADHVLLFTATPISRGAGDLLDLVALLGPDNFDDHTHAILRRLERRRRVVATLSDDEVAQLRTEIQRFTLRRTKTQINAMVDRQPDGYVHPTTGRICRYPVHDPELYPTGETPADEAAATEIRAVSRTLTGVAQLPRKLAVPPSLRSRLTDEAWVRFQLSATAGLVAHHVVASLRSSRAALHEHLHGTRSAQHAYALSRSPKATATGDVLAKLGRLASAGPPAIALDAELPDWLLDHDAWAARCAEEAARYRSIAAALERVSDTRERTKATHLARLAHGHRRVLAFDRHPTTLVFLHDLLVVHDHLRVEIATGQRHRDQQRVRQLFAPEHDDEQAVIALCSDAMSEGLNLQGASAMVHLDLPTTLRVAEQRVGRVDRMDSRHDRIEAWWPRDGAAFATRANERLASRFEESRSLLGANLPVPDLRGAGLGGESAEGGPDGVGAGDEAGADEVVDPAALHEEVEARLVAPADHLRDALEPVRSLVEGPDPLVPAGVYSRTRQVTARVLARVAPVASDAVWAFLAVRSAGRGVPRWLWVAPGAGEPCETELARVVDRLREHLADDPPSRGLDDEAAHHLSSCLELAARHEQALLPRRSRRALEQLHEVVGAWAARSRADGDEETGARWQRLAGLARPSPDDGHADPFVVAERWLELVAPRLEAHRRTTRGRRYALLRDITAGLRADPLDLADVEAAMSGLPLAAPLGDRVTVGILGVPTATR
jgi:superfamily II DNA or RNA helicase